MSGCKCNISLIIVLVSLLSSRAYSQQINSRDSIAEYNYQKAVMKPRVVYSVGSSFLVIPHVGSVTGFTFAPSLSVPISPKWSVNGGLIAGRYYSLGNFNREGIINGSSNELSVYGSASYHVNSQWTVYGGGIKRLAGTSPLNILPKTSYTLGSTYNFGNFSIGLAVQMSKWDNNFSHFPINGSQGFYSPY